MPPLPRFTPAPAHIRAYALFERRAGAKLSSIGAELGVSTAAIHKWASEAQVQPAFRTITDADWKRGIAQARERRAQRKAALSALIQNKLSNNPHHHESA